MSVSYEGPGAFSFGRRRRAPGDEELVERWAENVVWQHFSGMTRYEPRLPCDATQIGHFRVAIGEAGVEELLKATVDTAVHSKAIKPVEFERLIVDTTVQEKAICQRRFNSDPLPCLIAEVNLTHPGSFDCVARARRP